MRSLPFKKSLPTIQKFVLDATQAQTIAMLNDVANFDLPLADINSAKIKAKAVELSALVTASADAVSMAKAWLHQLSLGYPACEQASFWVR